MAFGLTNAVVKLENFHCFVPLLFALQSMLIEC